MELVNCVLEKSVVCCHTILHWVNIFWEFFLGKYTLLTKKTMKCRWKRTPKIVVDYFCSEKKILAKNRDAASLCTHLSFLHPPDHFGVPPPKVPPKKSPQVGLNWQKRQQGAYFLSLFLLLVVCIDFRQILWYAAQQTLNIKTHTTRSNGKPRGKMAEKIAIFGQTEINHFLASACIALHNSRF